MPAISSQPSPTPETATGTGAEPKFFWTGEVAHATFGSVMENQRFLQRLQAVLENFEADDAQRLSLEIHKAEDAGYAISPHEDRLWFQLTRRLTVRLVKDQNW